MIFYFRQIFDSGTGGRKGRSVLFFTPVRDGEIVSGSSIPADVAGITLDTPRIGYGWC